MALRRFSVVVRCLRPGASGAGALVGGVLTGDPIDRLDQRVDLERLAEKAGADRTDMFHGALTEQDARDEQDAVPDVGTDAPDLLSQEEAVHVGQKEIEDDHAEGAGLDPGQRLAAIGGSLDCVTASLEGVAHQIEDALFIVNQQDLRMKLCMLLTCLRRSRMLLVRTFLTTVLSTALTSWNF